MSKMVQQGVAHCGAKAIIPEYPAWRVLTWRMSVSGSTLLKGHELGLLDADQSQCLGASSCTHGHPHLQHRLVGPGV